MAEGLRSSSAFPSALRRSRTILRRQHPGSALSSDLGPVERGKPNMTLVSLLILLLVAGICGSIGEAIAGYSHGGCLVSVALGFIGALIGLWISRQLGLKELFAVEIAGERFPIVWSIIGSTLFVAIINLFRRRAF
jgi:uncharacterized membrane protein YeaQ/YmgE (transglycosylase-associated protein family)